MEKRNQNLDELSRIVARAGGITDDDVERITSSPFINARLRARIEAERRQRAEQRSGWFASLFIAWRVIAVLLLVTIGAAAAFLSTTIGAPTVVPRASDDVARVVAGGACALSATDECAISSEEVLATLFAEEGGEQKK
jgi:hypothetical protein